MRRFVFIPLLFVFSSCIIIPLPAHRIQGNTFIKPVTIDFIKPDTTLREEVLLKLGNPDGVALHESVFIYHWTVSKGIAGFTAGPGAAVVTDIKQERFFLVSFNANHTVKKREIINHNIDTRKKTLKDFVEEWEKGKPVEQYRK